MGPEDPAEDVVRAYTAEDLVLKMSAGGIAVVDGRASAAPDRIVMQFARPVVANERVGESALDDADFTVTPALDGDLRWADRSTLVFQPKAGFAPSTAYAIQLGSLRTGEEPIAPPEGGWRLAFQTPEFAMSQVDVRGQSKSRLELGLRFNALVDPSSLEGRLAVRIGGVPVPAKAIRVTSRSETQEVAVRIDHALTTRTAELEVLVGAGVESAHGDALAESVTSTLAHRPDAAVARVESVHLVEGSEQFSVEVICDDDSVPGYDRWTWKPAIERGFYVSRRCSVSEEEAKRAIHVEPEVDFSVVPTRGGFRLLGDFERGTYRVRIDSGMKSVDGGYFHGADKVLTVGTLSPRVSFTSNGRYLPKKFWKYLDVRHRNVDDVELAVRRIPKENLVFWMSGSDERATSRTSDVIFKKTFPVRGIPDEAGSTYIDVAEHLPPEKQGIYEITVDAGDGVKHTGRVLLTDMNLVAKVNAAEPGSKLPGTVHVWVLGMTTNNALRDVNVQAIRPSGKVVGECRTNVLGKCRIELVDDPLDDTAPFALLATKGRDTTYLKFDELKLQPSEFEVAGEPYTAEKPYRASVWTERGVYRPGDTAHISAVIREQDATAPEAGLPVTLELVDPRDRLIKRLSLETNAAGLVSAEVPFADYAATGRYEARLSIGGERVEALGFAVEEFVPERMRVEAESKKAAYLPSDALEMGVEAAYLFGGSAKGSRFEATCRLVPGAFQPQENQQLTYGVSGSARDALDPVALGTVSGTLGENGTGRFTCPKPSSGFRTAARVVADVSVFEAGSGRTTRGVATAPVHPAAFYVGLASNGQKLASGKEFEVSGTVVDWEGKPATGAVKTVQAELIRLDREYGWVLDEATGEERYRSYKRPVREQMVELPVENGTFTLRATPTAPAVEYMVRVTAGDTETELVLPGSQRGGYYWGRETARDLTPKPLKPQSMAIAVPDSIRVGESVPVSVTAPFKGALIVTVETDEVLETHTVPVEAGEHTWSFELKEFAPNIYVSAVLVKDALLDSSEAFVPDRAFGVESIQVVPEDYQQKLAMTVPETVRSSSELKVALDLGPLDKPTFVTVAAVDEGILSLTDFETPDPVADLFPKRALGVTTYETVGWGLKSSTKAPSSRTGGDGMGPPKRIQMVKPVSLWSGVLEVPASGKLDVTLDVPQYRGELRVMAVAVGEERAGSAEASVVVRDPLTVQTTLPRFLIDGDEAEIPVFLTNTSGAPQTVALSMATQPLDLPGLPKDGGPKVEFVGSDRASIAIADGESKTVVFRVRASGSFGGARFEVVAKAGALESRESLEVPFSSDGPRERKVELVKLDGAAEIDLAKMVEGWVPGTDRTTFWVTNNPYGQAFGHLKYLVRYPYGCIEQTSSSTRPLLYVKNLLPVVDAELAARSDIGEMVMSGVDRIVSMQTPSGGFGYWPGASEPVVWGTAYATHLLIDAEKAGYPVPREAIEDAVDWLSSEVEGSANDSSAYVHYVLALAGEGRKGEMLQLVERLRGGDSETAEQRYLLKAGLYLAGDRRFERDLKRPDTRPLTGERKNTWSFYSDLRRRGLMLSIYTDLFGNEGAGGEALARLVGTGLEAKSSSRYYTTQELMWGINGLGRWVEQSATGVEAPRLMANGKALPSTQDANGSAGKTAERSWEVPMAAGYGSLLLEAKGAGERYLVVNTEGVSDGQTWTSGGASLRVSRSFHDADGDVIDWSRHALGDIVYSKVTVKNDSRERIQNISLVDRYPAGWEIENPRLGRGGALHWLEAGSVWTLDHMNLRDDRIEAFGHLAPGEERSVVVMLRAVTAGEFVVPPVEVEAMYDPSKWARQVGRRIQIAGPWAGLYL